MQEHPETSRRRFLKATTDAAATASVLRPTFTIAAEGANARVGVGFIGAGGRAGAHIDIVRALKAEGRCEPVAVCDIYAPRVEAAAQRTGGKIYRNYHDLLADPRVDVVCIATPDRHHAPQAIDAVRAGKDVYCEKPLTHWSQMELAKETIIPWQGAGNTAKLWSNFLDCVKSRQKPYSPIDIAVRVQAPLNMGILSHREGKVARFDKQKMAIVL